jgi:Cys-rich four helix bundle protein (predicted Tat secretion target)
MNRRDWIAAGATGAGGLTALMTTAAALAKAGAHDHHDHHHAVYESLTKATAGCITSGEACLAHCLILLGQGDSAMAECAVSVNELMAACTALHKLSVQESAYVGRMAHVVGQICADCEKQCKKHADKHPQCKDCAEHCARCVKECKRLAVS